MRKRIGPVPRRCRYALGLLAMTLAPIVWGCSDGAGTVNGPVAGPVAGPDSAPAVVKVKGRAVGPALERMPRGPGQTKGGP